MKAEQRRTVRRIAWALALYDSLEVDHQDPERLCREIVDKLEDREAVQELTEAEGVDLRYARRRLQEVAERKVRTRQRRRSHARARREAIASLGMREVRGNLGGVYYE